MFIPQLCASKRKNATGPHEEHDRTSGRIRPDLRKNTNGTGPQEEHNRKQRKTHTPPSYTRHSRKPNKKRIADRGTMEP
jgi:hypothetical protein